MKTGFFCSTKMDFINTAQFKAKPLHNRNFKSQTVAFA